MLHIVFITPVFAVDENDSVTLPFMQLFLKEILKEQVSISIICEQYPYEEYNWNNIPIYTLKKNTSKIFYKFLRKYRLNKTLRKIHKIQKIDIVHNFWFNILGHISYHFAKVNGIKHVVTLTGQDILVDNPYLRFIENYKGTLVSPSEFHKNQLLIRYPKLTVQVIQWGIEEIKVRECNRSIDIIQCGWINPVKNHGYFLEIISALWKKQLIQKVVICGGGPLFENLLSDIKKLELEKLIDIKNSIPREEVLELMKQSKILVHTSIFESFGLVLAEGLACGCKVISTPVGIAFDDEDISCCSDKEEFLSEVETALKTYNHKNTRELQKYPIRKTASSYMDRYRA